MFNNVHYFPFSCSHWKFSSNLHMFAWDPLLPSSSTQPRFGLFHSTLALHSMESGSIKSYKHHLMCDSGFSFIVLLLLHACNLDLPKQSPGAPSIGRHSPLGSMLHKNVDQAYLVFPSWAPEVFLEWTMPKEVDSISRLECGAQYLNNRIWEYQIGKKSFVALKSVYPASFSVL